MSKEKVLRSIMKSLKRTLPCPVKEISFFGGTVTKPWPRKDVDVYIKASYSPCWSDFLEMKDIEDLVYEVNEDSTKASGKPVDAWLHFPGLGELWHEEGLIGATEMWSENPKVAEEVVASQKRTYGLNAKKR